MAGNALDRRHAALGPHALLLYDEPVELVRGEGVWVWDQAGRRYLDAYNNVPHVGHCHPRVVAAGQAQLATLNIHGRYLNEGVTAYAERLLGLFPPQLDRLMFTCTGTEANELALRIARHASGASGIIVSSFSYHGNSTLLAGLTRALPSAEPFPEWARTVEIDAATTEASFAEDIDRAVASLVAAGHGVAALLVCPAFTFEGLPALLPGFLATGVERVRAAGGFYIADEVQAGFGRTGTHMWGWQRHGVAPDLVTLGKPMANGYPMGAVVGGAEPIDRFSGAAVYFNTYAASPVGCAMGAAVLDVLEGDRLQDNAAVTGADLVARLAAAARDCDAVRDVRGLGLYVAVEMRSGAIAKAMVEHMRGNGVLISRTGRGDAVLKIRPPMPFARDHAALLAQQFRKGLDEIGPADAY